ncbi:hypothetical protein DFH08DRAFT_971117 [Mycena albidolilacea]|uniref:Uncharacterized protein n=1 Tax=Mycena albidolilacea TaxID=1033008 RepID=A0AAD6ZE71_9AGAR|nr:hypothetical protein DFH08DRAFT_971117 [Mycena albidolilacea]
MPNKCPSLFLSPHHLVFVIPANLGVHPRITLPPAQLNTAPPPAPLPSIQTATARRPPCPSDERQCFSCTCPGNAQCAMRRCKVCCRSLATSHCRIHEPWPPALSTSTLQILDTAEAAAAFPAPCHLQRELPHQHLARQQETAPRLTALPPSPMLSQEARDEALTVLLALGTSPPLSITTPHTCRVSLVS